MMHDDYGVANNDNKYLSDLPQMNAYIDNAEIQNVVINTDASVHKKKQNMRDESEGRKTERVKQPRSPHR